MNIGLLANLVTFSGFWGAFNLCLPEGLPVLYPARAPASYLAPPSGAVALRERGLLGLQQRPLVKEILICK